MTFFVCNLCKCIFRPLVVEKESGVSEITLRCIDCSPREWARLLEVDGRSLALLDEDER